MQNGGGIVFQQCGTQENGSADSFPLVPGYSHSLFRPNDSDDSSQSSGPAPTPASESSTMTPPVLLQEDHFHHVVSAPDIMEHTTPDLHHRPTVSCASRHEKSHRHHFRKDQTAHLEAFFQKCRYPDYMQRMQLAEIIDAGRDEINEKRVQVWFKNRRSKQHKKAGTTPAARASRPGRPAESVSSSPVESSSTTPLASQPFGIPSIQNGFQLQFQGSDRAHNVLRLIMPDACLAVPGGNEYSVWESIKDDIAAVNAGISADMQKPVDPPASSVPLPHEPGWVCPQSPVQTAGMEDNNGYSPPANDTWTVNPDRAEQSPDKAPPSELGTTRLIVPAPLTATK